MTHKEILRAMVYELCEDETQEQKEARVARMWRHHVVMKAAKKKKALDLRDFEAKTAALEPIE